MYSQNPHCCSCFYNTKEIQINFVPTISAITSYISENAYVIVQTGISFYVKNVRILQWAYLAEVRLCKCCDLEVSHYDFQIFTNKDVIILILVGVNFFCKSSLWLIIASIIEGKHYTTILKWFATDVTNWIKHISNKSTYLITLFLIVKQK